MIVIASPRSRRQAAAEAALVALQAAGVSLSASASALARDTPPAAFSGSRVAPSGLTLAMQAAGRVVEASAEDLAVINDLHSGQALDAADVVVLQDYALSDARIDYPPIRFTGAALAKLAAHAEEGRTVCFNHDTDQVIGATFAAHVEGATVRGIEATWLRLRWYAVLTDQTSAERRQRVQDCRTGVLRYGSVGISGGSWDFVEVEGPNGFEYFYLIDDSDDLRLREYSRCYLGAAHGAGDSKFAAPAPTTPPTQPASGGTPKTLCVL